MSAPAPSTDESRIVGDLGADVDRPFLAASGQRPRARCWSGSYDGCRVRGRACAAGAGRLVHRDPARRSARFLDDDAGPGREPPGDDGEPGLSGPSRRAAPAGGAGRPCLPGVYRRRGACVDLQEGEGPAARASAGRPVSRQRRRFARCIRCGAGATLGWTCSSRIWPRPSRSTCRASASPDHGRAIKPASRPGSETRRDRGPPASAAACPGPTRSARWPGCSIWAAPSCGAP